jgi:hypothetical protein
LGIVLFCLGFPDQAKAQSNAAIAEARRLAHPPTLATSLTLGAVPLWLGFMPSLSKNGHGLLARPRLADNVHMRKPIGLLDADRNSLISKICNCEVRGRIV